MRLIPIRSPGVSFDNAICFPFQILEVAKEICDSSDHDKKAFIKTKIESMYSKLDGEQKKRYVVTYNIVFDELNQMQLPSGY